MGYTQPDDIARCSVEGCTNTIKDHAWGHIKAAGWWFPMDRSLPVFCPEHLPEWVEEWRAKKRGARV